MTTPGTPRPSYCEGWILDQLIDLGPDQGYTPELLAGDLKHDVAVTRRYLEQLWKLGLAMRLTLVDGSVVYWATDLGRDVAEKLDRSAA